MAAPFPLPPLPSQQVLPPPPLCSPLLPSLETAAPLLGARPTVYACARLTVRRGQAGLDSPPAATNQKKTNHEVVQFSGVHWWFIVRKQPLITPIHYFSDPCPSLYVTILSKLNWPDWTSQEMDSHTKCEQNGDYSNKFGVMKQIIYICNAFGPLLGGFPGGWKMYLYLSIATK